mgnify:FL=1
MHLIADGWTILHFSYDIVMHRPRQAQQLLRQIIWGRESRLMSGQLTPAEKEAIRFGKLRNGPISPGQLGDYLGLSGKTVRKLLKNLADKQIFRPTRPGRERVRSYELTQRGMDMWTGH